MDGVSLYSLEPQTRLTFASGFHLSVGYNVSLGFAPQLLSLCHLHAYIVCGKGVLCW